MGGDAEHDHPPDFGPPPEAWLAVRRLHLAIVGPLERFIHLEASGALLLIVAAATALIWANSSAAESYQHLWHTSFSVGFGDARFDRPLHFWVNDVLMTLFFLVVGYEIKRELVQGALSDVRRATLPVVAAIGGMVVPAAVYAACNLGGPGASGWGIPMATDIAFAVGIMIFLGRRVSPALRVLLLAVAIADDLGAVLVLAIFYTPEIHLTGIAVTGGGLALLWVMRRAGVRPGAPYLLPISIAWVGLYITGIHPTVAGVLVGFSAPVEPWLNYAQFREVADKAIDEYHRRRNQGEDDHDLLVPLQHLVQAGREAASPALRGQVFFHPWVAFVVVPVFALANAGVQLQGDALAAAGSGAVAAGVFLGLFVGKPLGILAFSWVAVRLGLCALPPGVSWRGIGLLGIVAGIGFTMSIFIGELAFDDKALLAAAKLGVLAATAAAAVAALAYGWFVMPKESPISDVSATLFESSPEMWVVSPDGTPQPPPPAA